MITLYHFTSKLGLQQILAHGFVDGDDGLVWLCEHPTQELGARDRSVLLAVSLAFGAEELKAYRVPVEYEPCDEDDPEWNWCPTDVVFFAIPAMILNPSCSVRIIPAEERRRLVM